MFCVGISLIRPKLSLCSTWDRHGITFANEGVLGKYPVSLFINIHNDIYAFNRENNRILIWLNQSSTVDEISVPDVMNSFSLFVLENNDILIDNGYAKRRVDKVMMNGTVIVSVMSVNSSCTGLFVDQVDRLYCSSANEHQVFVIELNRNVTKVMSVAGSGCPGPLETMLDHPHGIYVDEHFNLFVADTNNNRIQQFKQNKTSGITIVGFGSSNGFLLNKPTSLTFDAHDALYIVDSQNHRIIRSISNGFECLFGCSDDRSSSLNNPLTMAFDPNGDIFVVDSNHHRIEKYLLITNSSKSMFHFMKYHSVQI